MSRVLQRELFEGQVADAASFNATLSSWNSATSAGQLGADNFREEGLDVRAFDPGFTTKRLTVAQSSGGTVSLGAGPWPAFIPVAGGLTPVSFSLPQLTSWALVRASFAARNNTTLISIARASFALEMSVNGGAYVQLPTSVRTFENYIGLMPNLNISSTLAVGITTLSAGATFSIRLVVSAASISGTFDIDHSTLSAEVYYR